MVGYAKFVLGYVLAILALFLLPTLLPPQAPQISYAMFKRYLAADQVEQVLLSKTRIRGMLKSGTVAEGKGEMTFGFAEIELVKVVSSQVVPMRNLFAHRVFSQVRVGLGDVGDECWNKACGMELRIGAEKKMTVR